jgi:putative SOS response-associated peptidase YedK
MCGRLGIDILLEGAEKLRLQRQLIKMERRDNASPGTRVPVIRRTVAAGTTDNELVPLHWGLVPSWMESWRPGDILSCARGETVGDKPSFRSAYKRRRCLIPARVWYEWQQGGKGSKKQPWLFRLRSAPQMLIAGIWEQWTPRHPDDVQEPLESFAIVTTEPNAFCARIHDRMPVILAEEAWDTWLDPQTPRPQLDALIKPWANDDIEAWRVTKSINDARYQGPDCMTPVEAPPEQPELFGELFEAS